MAKSYSKGRKNCGKKEKLLVTSNFSFFHSVFKRTVLHTIKSKSLFGRGLIQFPKLLEREREREREREGEREREREREREGEREGERERERGGPAVHLSQINYRYFHSCILLGDAVPWYLSCAH